VVWQEPTAKGSYLLLDPNGGGLALYNDQDKVMWQIGAATASATSTTTENDAMNVLKVTENGTVELLSRNGSIHWAIKVNGIATAM
jgi:catechol-2,3-dioxygenase